MTASTKRLAVVAVLSGIVLAAGAVIAFVPSLVVERVPAIVPALEAIDPTLALLVVALVLVIAAPIVGIRSRLGAASTTPLVAADDEATAPALGPRTDSGPEVVGKRLDRHVTVATNYDGATRDQRDRAREDIVAVLRPIAADAYAQATGRPREDALAAVESGDWTDDSRAAAFLAGEDGPSTPPSVWVYDLLTTADPFTRALGRTMAEIERIQSTPEVAA